MENRTILDAIDAEIAQLEEAKRLLLKVEGRGSSKRNSSSPGRRTKHKLSPEARAKIAEAQRKRWAAVRKAAK